MTTTARPQPTRPTAIDPRPRRRRRSGRRGRLIALAVLAAVAGVLLLGDGGASHDMPPASPVEEARGIYRLPDGDLLLLWGNAHHPLVELDGTVTMLTVDGPDRYRSSDSDDIAVVRDDTGQVTGLQVHDSHGVRTATRTRAHNEEPVEFAHDGARLAGTLVLPAGPGPHPAVVLLHGAHPATRDSYLLDASHLARRGVAALIYDKRGVGESSGNHAAATFDDLTDDALAAVDALRDHPVIDADRIGVMGFSQGAWVAAMAATRDPGVAFVITISASGFSPADQQAWLHGSMLAARGFDRRAMRIADRVDRMLYSSLDLVDAGMLPRMPQVPGFWFHSLDPHTDSEALWESVTQPVLGLWGALDCQLPAHDSAEIIERALRRSGNHDVTTAILPGADHGLVLAAPCGHETGLAEHSAMRYAEGAHTIPAAWITDGTLEHPAAAAPRHSREVLHWHLPTPAPAPWYGAIAVQLALISLLVVGFAALAVRAIRSSRARANPHRTATAVLGAVGLLATLAGFAAIVEIAMLGDTHARFLLGGPTVDGASPLLVIARTAAVATLLSTVGTLWLGVRAKRRGPGIAASALLAIVFIAWAQYWVLPPLA